MFARGKRRRGQTSGEGERKGGMKRTTIPRVERRGRSRERSEIPATDGAEERTDERDWKEDQEGEDSA